MKLTYVECKIASGTSLSAEIDFRDRDVIGLAMPTTWDAAGIAFQSAGVPYDQARAITGGIEPFQGVVDDTGAVVGLTVAQATFVCFREATIWLLRGLGRTKVRSGTNAAPVNQTADRILTFVCLMYPS